MPIISQNPATGEINQTFEEDSIDLVKQKLMKADQAFAEWSQTDLNARLELMKKLRQVFEERAEEYARLVTIEMGKTITDSRAELKKCLWAIDYYLENAARQLAPQIIKTEATESLVRFDPLGTILIVMPWNFPFWQVLRALVPNLVAGNTLVLKHASNVPQVALAIEKSCLEAGFPEGVFQTLLIGSAAVAAVIENPIIKGVALTGSEAAGSQVAMLAGKNLKPSVLELGGSDPFIVFADADLEEAVSAAVTSRTLTNGEVCNAAKRFLIEKAVYPEFLRLMKEKFANLKIGDPLAPSTQLGPLVNPVGLEFLRNQVAIALKEGAELVYGESITETKLPEQGNYFVPTILTKINPKSSINFEETFGPVALVYSFETEAEMLALANGTDFGLGASLWSKDIAKLQRLVPQIQAGNVFLNKMVASHPALPFGGIKRSGYGRELSEFGLRAFLNIKTVYRK